MVNFETSIYPFTFWCKTERSQSVRVLVLLLGVGAPATSAGVGHVQERGRLPLVDRGAPAHGTLPPDVRRHVRCRVLLRQLGFAVTVTLVHVVRGGRSGDGLLPPDGPVIGEPGALGPGGGPPAPALGRTGVRRAAALGDRLHARGSRGADRRGASLGTRYVVRVVVRHFEHWSRFGAVEASRRRSTVFAAAVWMAARRAWLFSEADIHLSLHSMLLVACLAFRLHIRLLDVPTPHGCHSRPDWWVQFDGIGDFSSVQLAIYRAKRDST